VFVLPTRQILSDDEIEGFGIAYVEAAAAGVPSIAAGVGGVADAVIDDVTGLLVPPSSPGAVARATLQVLGDPALRQRLGRNARANVERHLNWDRAARQVLSIVSDVIRSRERSVGAIVPEPLVRPGLEQESGRA
jgi:glycosyltransferase involved in cell wall biosynthesis